MSFKLTKSNLNFDVYAVASKPTTPGTNNDIAIITSVPMPNWIMSPDKPSGIPRSAGDVWIQYSVSGNTFNALKNNTMMIATIKAWQYVYGAWTEVEAVSYQNGEWVDWWNGELFDNGNQYEAVTGGWVRNTNLKLYGGSNTDTATVGDVLSVRSKSGTAAMLTTKNAIDVTDFNYVLIDVKSFTTNAYVAIHSFESGNLEDSGAQGWSSKTGEYTINISGLSGKHYISVGGNGGLCCDIARIQLLR